MATGLRGEDIRGGIQDADNVVKDVQGDIRSLARETRWEGLVGKDRDQFLNGMTQDEFDTLKEIATAMGPKGLSKLEGVLYEMQSLKKGGN